MIDIKKKIQCCGCEACKNICPKSCIEMIEDNEGFLYPKVDLVQCIGCNLCEKICPIINKKERNGILDAVAFQHSNNEVRYESASGGAFSAISEYIIEKKGVVYGVVFSDDFEIIHTRLDNIKELKNMRGSKYVQSKIYNSYALCKEDLKAGKLVCFSGTPCQIEGLLNYLGKDYQNLLTVDLVCHGVPSPKVWKKYILDLETKQESKIIRYSFRSKKTGYHDFGTEIHFANGTEIYTHDKGDKKDFMHLAFFNELCSRPSCHDCAFKTLNRRSDFTLFDLWHLAEFVPQYEDDNGTSAVFAHSEKAVVILDELMKKHRLIKIDYKKAMDLDGNNIEFSMRPNKRRAEFFLDLDKMAIDEMMTKYFGRSKKNVDLTLLKRILKKIGIFDCTKKMVYSLSKYKNRNKI